MFTLNDGTAKVVFKDGVTQDRINTLVFPGPGLGAARAIGVAGLGDLSGDGSSDIAVLFRKANGQGGCRSGTPARAGGSTRCSTSAKTGMWWQ